MRTLIVNPRLGQLCVGAIVAFSLALIADEVCRAAKLPDNAASLHTVAIRGREEKLQVRAVAEARRLVLDDGLDESALKLPMSLPI